MPIQPHELKFIDRVSDVWVLVPKPGVQHPVQVYSTEDAARLCYRNQQSQLHSPEKAKLHRPSLQPIYGGPTLLEALWAEMDRLMEGLMTGQDRDDTCGRKGYHGVPFQYEGDSESPCEHEDNGDKYRAQELAWVLAVVTNAYNPSVDLIRAQAMQRWTEKQAEEEEDDQ
jgi:hypothetical protein